MATTQAFRDIERRFDENGAEHREIRDEIQAVRKEVKQEHANLWSAVDGLRNRLPLWATLLISVLVAIVSVACTFAGTLLLKIIFKQ